MWVQRQDKATGSFHEAPHETLQKEDHAIRCTHHSALAFQEDDVTFYACRYHAPEDLLENLGIPIPKDRHREGRISV